MEKPQMTAQAPKEKAETSKKSTKDELSKYGISRVSTDHFHYENYKYTDLKDAIAQAKRDLKADKT